LIKIGILNSKKLSYLSLKPANMRYDFLTKTGIDVKYSTCTIQWFENELPLQNPHTLKNKDYVAMAEITAIQQEMEFFGMDWYDPTCYANEILDAKYEQVHIDDVVSQL
jgi:hypothetical protein